MNKLLTPRLTAPLTALLLAPLIAVGQDSSFGYDTVGGWSVRTDPSRDYRCFIEADYDNGSAIRAGFNSDSGRFYITIADYRWDWIEPGSEYRVSLQFDEGPAQRFDATGVSLETQYVLSGLRMELPPEAEDSVVSQFMYLSEMRLSYEGEPVALPDDNAADTDPAEPEALADDSERNIVELTLGLFGTQRAVESLEGCQIQMARTAPATEFSAVQ